jgi:hypothetical protein
MVVMRRVGNARHVISGSREAYTPTSKDTKEKVKDTRTSKKRTKEAEDRSTSQE